MIASQIDAAMVLMKARAAEFNKTKTMEGMTAYGLSSRAAANLNRARHCMSLPDPMDCRECDARTIAVTIDLLDTMNLCALALSVLPKGGS